MLERDEPFLIVSYSGRALAGSANRAGHTNVSVIDLFGDCDTRSVCTANVVVEAATHGFEPSSLLAAAHQLDPHARCGVVYGSGFEAAPELLERLCADRALLGNGARVIREAKDPMRFSALLQRLEIPTPPTRAERPLRTAGWLSKRAGAAGGGHVRWLRGAPEMSVTPDRYYQRYVAGISVSVTVLGDGVNHRVVGYCRQWCTGEEAHGAFSYLGAVTLDPGQLSEAARNAMVEAAARLVRALELRGLFSLDFIIDDDHCWLIELNPRPGATVELHDSPAWLFDAHINALRGTLTGALASPTACANGHRIVYARTPLEVPERTNWPPWVTDRPDAGTRFGAFEPVCTVHAKASSSGLADAYVHSRWRAMHHRVHRWASVR